jgi:insertion element IS1 protein InsB
VHARTTLSLSAPGLPGQVLHAQLPLPGLWAGHQGPSCRDGHQQRRGIRGTARVLKINKNTVTSALKKASALVQVNPPFLKDAGKPREVRLEPACLEAGLDEQWPFVGNKPNQRWLWYAVGHATNTVLAYVPGKRKGTVSQDLKALLAPFNVVRYYTDDWGAYGRHLDANTHGAGKRSAQKIERLNLNFRA